MFARLVMRSIVRQCKTHKDVIYSHWDPRQTMPGLGLDMGRISSQRNRGEEGSSLREVGGRIKVTVFLSKRLSELWHEVWTLMLNTRCKVT